MTKVNIKRVLIAGIGAFAAVCVYAFPAELFLARGTLKFYELSPEVWKFLDYQVSDYLLFVFAKMLAIIILAVLFAVLYKSVPGQGLKKGFWFGVLIYLFTLPPRIDFYFLINAPNIVNIWWAISQFIEVIIIGIGIAVIYKPKEDFKNVQK